MTFIQDLFIITFASHDMGMTNVQMHAVFIMSIVYVWMTFSPQICGTNSCPLSLLCNHGKFQYSHLDSEFQVFAAVSVPVDAIPSSPRGRRCFPKTTLETGTRPLRLRPYPPPAC